MSIDAEASRSIAHAYASDSQWEYSYLFLHIFSLTLQEGEVSAAYSSTHESRRTNIQT